MSEMVVDLDEVRASMKRMAKMVADEKLDMLPADTVEGMIDSFVFDYGDRFRVVADDNDRWFVRDDVGWIEDKGKTRYQCAAAIVRDSAESCGDKKLSRSILNGTTRRKIVELAALHPRFVTLAEHWDCDPYALSTPAGAFDLRTGERIEPPLSMHRTAVAPDDEARCPQWRQFIEQITCGDTDLAAYLQRLAGYALTGRANEECLIFAHGGGANGKGTFFGMLMAVMGTYARGVDPRILTETRSEQHRQSIASLLGARLALAEEISEGKVWDEGELKRMTGGEDATITANFMRANNFDFHPRFTLVITANNKPRIRTVDNAIKRRLQLVPFAADFSAAPDLELKQRLRRDEAGGILRWMMDGTLMWLEKGLAPPKAVTDATAEYLAEQDSLGTWIDETLRIGPQFAEAFTTNGDLFRNWRAWCEARGLNAGTQTKLIQTLKTRWSVASWPVVGMHTVTRNRGWYGVEIGVAERNGEAAWYED